MDIEGTKIGLPKTKNKKNMKIVSNTKRYCRAGSATQKNHTTRKPHHGMSVFFNVIFAVVIILMSAKLLNLLETSLTNSIESVSAATYRDTIVDPYYYTDIKNIETGSLQQGDLDIEPVIEEEVEGEENSAVAIAE
ncbi:hypothetical protein ISR92_02740 [Patescibacteria group bacterium]|nr:hypothetical protein [Patescibacteria group bacterium]